MYEKKRELVEGKREKLNSINLKFPMKLGADDAHR